MHAGPGGVQGVQGSGGAHHVHEVWGDVQGEEVVGGNDLKNSKLGSEIYIQVKWDQVIAGEANEAESSIYVIGKFPNQLNIVF